jgi:signal peptidase II
MRAARWLALIAAAVATIGCDRITKHAASTMLAGQPGRSYLADTVRLDYAENTGGFLGLGADLPPVARTVVFSVGTGFALVAFIALAVRKRLTFLAALGLVLFVAGGSSNLIDRIARGSVVDFLNVGIGPLRTGIFNVADAAIMCGAGLFVLVELHRSRAGRRHA